VLHHASGRGEQGHGVGGGVGVDSNDTVVLLGDGPHGESPLGNGNLRCRPGRFPRQTCNESRPRSDRLLIKPSGRAEPASPPAVDGHINCKASADHRSTGLRSRVTQESRPQPRRHQLCQPAPGQPARSLTGHSGCLPGRQLIAGALNQLFPRRATIVRTITRACERPVWQAEPSGHVRRCP
jgi:hypothetical protein